MAKFFLFIFTILLSLSLGLFVGQNYLLDAEKPEVLISENLWDKVPELSLQAKFNKLLDKFFANDKVSKDNLKESKAFIEAESPEEQWSENTYEADKTNVPNPVKTVTHTKPRINDIDLEGTSKGWVIQASAFQDLNDALKVQQQIIDAGFPHYIYKAKINNQLWYRVNIGPFDSVTEATNFKQTQKVHIKFKGAFVRKL